MQFTNAIVIALAGLVAAKGGNSTHGTSTKSECKQIRKLTQITKLAANSTELSMVTDNNATKMAEIQAKAAEATTKLATLSSNTTLMDACSTINAQKDMEHDCHQISQLERANKIVNNATLLAKWTDNNATKADKFKAKVAAKQGELTALSSNTTLTSFCAVQNDKMACKSITWLGKEQALSANTTALRDKWDAEKIAKFQAKVKEQTIKMNSLLTNTSLLSTCTSLGVNVSAVTIANAATAGSTHASSAAINVKSLAGGQIFALVSAFACALTML